MLKIANVAIPELSRIPHMKRFENKVCLVTGAGSGIGLQIAKAALTSGNKVVATGRDVNKVSRAIGDTTNNLLLVKMDVVGPGIHEGDGKARVAIAIRIATADADAVQEINERGTLAARSPQGCRQVSIKAARHV